MLNVWDASVNEGTCASRRLNLNILAAASLIQVAASDRRRSV